jgi:hypothetical protein
VRDNKEGTIVNKEITTCPVCKREGIEEEQISQSMASYHCPVCGEYEMPTFVPEVRGTSAPNRKLSAWIREQNERRETVRFTKKEMLETILASIPDYRPSEKQLKLLQSIERRTDRPSQAIALDARTDFPLAYADDFKELNFYLEALEERMLIRPTGKEIDRSHDNVTPWTVAITATGWDYLDKHASDPKREDAGIRRHVVLDCDEADLGRRDEACNTQSRVHTLPCR